MDNSPILFSIENHIAKISFNRPDNRNSMDQETMPAFQKTIKQVKSEKDLRCLVITGSGNTFCGGADFNSTALNELQPLFNEVLMGLYKPFLEIGQLKIPVIGAMNGHAVGGGLGLALMCDIRVANAQARYGANFARLGLHSGMAISYILPRLVGLPKANELLFTGRLISGKESAAIGLANYAVEKGQVMEKSMAIANEIAGSAPVAVQMMKRSIYGGLDWNPVKAAEMEALLQSRTFEMEDAKEGISALLEKRVPLFKGN